MKKLLFNKSFSPNNNNFWGYKEINALKIQTNTVKVNTLSQINV